jgi:hypothetical protein
VRILIIATVLSSHVPFSAVIYPDPKFGSPRDDGSMHPDFYWHALICELRKDPRKNEVIGQICALLDPSHLEKTWARVEWFWRKEDVQAHPGIRRPQLRAL